MRFRDIRLGELTVSNRENQVTSSSFNRLWDWPSEYMWQKCHSYCHTICSCGVPLQVLEFRWAGEITRLTKQWIFGQLSLKGARSKSRVCASQPFWDHFRRISPASIQEEPNTSISRDCFWSFSILCHRPPSLLRKTHRAANLHILSIMAVEKNAEDSKLEGK